MIHRILTGQNWISGLGSCWLKVVFYWFWTIHRILFWLKVVFYWFWTIHKILFGWKLFFWSRTMHRILTGWFLLFKGLQDLDFHLFFIFHLWPKKTGLWLERFVKKITVKCLFYAPGGLTFFKRGAFYKDQAIVEMFLFSLSSNDVKSPCKSCLNTF